jgi:hypothetical protein
MPPSFRISDQNFVRIHLPHSLVCYIRHIYYCATVNKTNIAVFTFHNANRDGANVTRIKIFTKDNFGPRRKYYLSKLMF